MKRTVNPMIETVKYRIKPKKTKLMVDIYKTAPYCTVEDLDKRNGTSWATNSSFPDQELEFLAEDKKEESAFIHEVDGLEGDVYINTNGKKVRILSMPNVCKIDDNEARKVKTRRKGSKFVMEKKKSGQKSMKFSPNSKKAITGQEENAAIKKSRNKEDMREKTMEAQVHYKPMDNLVITRPPWACSKQTALAKKRLRGVCLTDNCDDPSSIRSNESKLSSLKKSRLLERREQNAGSKVNVKRKFTALKKSHDHCLSMGNPVTEPSHGSIEQKSIMEEEDTKKKSITPKSTYDDSSFIGLQIISDSGIKDQVSFQPDHVGIERSFMALKNSLDDEYYYNKFNTQEDTKNIINGQNTEDIMDSILIPGPPGSFLPLSPGADMVSEELQGNSSLTNTSRGQSSDQDHHHHEILNTDFISESPVSTVSNSSFARSSDLLSARFMGDLKSVDADFRKEGPNLSDFQIDQPCCSSKRVGSYHQASREQAPESNSMNIRSCADASVKLPSHRDCESAISPSTPVIRLMGINLTVVKTNDDPPYSSPMSHQQVHNVRNYDESSFSYGHPQHFNSPPPYYQTSHSDLRPVDCQRLDSHMNNADTMYATKKIIGIDDSTANEARDDHMQQLYSSGDPYGGGFLPVFQNGNFQTPSTYYPRTFW